MIRRKGLILWGLRFLMLAALALPASLKAQRNFVYTNDDINGDNTVSGFSVAPDGTLTLLERSPFATEGTGCFLCYTASNRITVSAGGNLLFASNTQSNNVSVFRIDEKSGALTLVAGSPFATGGSGGLGIALSATPDGRFLVAANAGSNNITVYRIAHGGKLFPVAGSPFGALSTPDGIKMSPNGKFLAVAEPPAQQVEMFRIAHDGGLTSLGAFNETGTGRLAGVDINCASSLLYGGEYYLAGTIVDGYSISHTGTLTPLLDSPFAGLAVDSELVLLGYGLGWKTLFVSNQVSYSITVFSVAADGALSPVAGSPFFLKPGTGFPAGMATSQDGRLLYVARTDNKVSAFSVAKGGALAEVAGSPFATGQSGALESLTAFPPRELSLLEALLDGCPAGL